MNTIQRVLLASVGVTTIFVGVFIVVWPPRHFKIKEIGPCDQGGMCAVVTEEGYYCRMRTPVIAAKIPSSWCY